MQCNEVLKSLPIFHVHGSVGPLPWEETGGSPYGEEVTVGRVREAADNIRIVSDETAGIKAFQDAREHVLKAERLIFLGFGFAGTNISRLHVVENQTATKQGTAYQMPNPMRKAVREMIDGINLAKSRHNILQYLSEFDVLR